ncbi:MAG: PAS domain-containing protein [Planctomycetes bacterium]|nr:PAS domain-containing protein [Planctomycetota bacterium]
MPEPQNPHFGDLNKTNAQPEINASNSGAGQNSNFGLVGKPAIESLPIGVVAFDCDLKIIEANSQAAKLIKLGNYIDRSLAKSSDDSSASKLDWKEQLKTAISEGKSHKFDNVNYILNGKTKLLQIVCTPFKVAKDLGGIITIEDVTEKANIQKQLANAEKLATVGKLASKVAHELNNPMDGILRYINLAIRVIEQEKLEKPIEYLTQCRQGLIRMVQIISELLEFSRNTYASLENVKIDQIIEDAIKTMEPKAEASGIYILRDYTTETPKIRSSNLFQVFCNLAKNAVEAMPDGGELSISTRLMSDDTIVAEFRDTGIGFAAENIEAIFEPFFTTKDKSKGTGLGLAICKDIVERCHGRITAENATEGGSIFTVYLPVAFNS